MEIGICMLSIIPVREHPTDKSQMVTQLLFGETYTILEREEKWLSIKIDHDAYEGWIDKKQFEPAQKTTQNAALTFDLTHPIVINSQHIPLVLGSKLPHFDGINCRIEKQKATYNGLAVQPKEFVLNEERITKTAQKYLHTPYLWGGRSPFGIDCSGLTQNVYQFFGIALQRDAHQQATQGQIVGFVEEAQPGDLAFFDREEDGHIIHVGIILKDKQIIHASGKVRIDPIDHFGIFNKNENKYTHKLRIIKRVV